MNDNTPVNSPTWDANSVVLIESRLVQWHRKMIFKRSRLAELVTDRQAEILDVGCGSGPFLRYFAAQGFARLSAIEPDAELIKNIPASLCVTVRNCRVEQIAFPAGTFDVAFVYGVLHHLENVMAYEIGCREIYRVLKPGGLLFIMEPGRYGFFRMVEGAAKILAVFSKTMRAFSECLEEEGIIQRSFIKNHHVVRDTLAACGAQPIVDRYFLYSWIYTTRKAEHD